MGRFITAGLFLLLGLLLWLGNLDPGVAVRAIAVEASPEQQLTGRLYTPAQADSPVPAVLMCHGLGSNKDTFTPLAREFARHGMGAVVFDFGGYGESYRRPVAQSANGIDAAAMLAWMKQQPELDAERFGVVGHSMGGTTALETGQAHQSLKMTIVLGIGGAATPMSPANLMFGTGVYEEFNPVGQMEALLASAAGTLLEEAEPEDASVAQRTSGSIAGRTISNRTFGDFGKGTARRLSLSPTVEHGLAPYDRQLQADSIRWAQSAFGLSPNVRPLQGQWQMAGMVLSVVGAIFLSQSGLGWALGRVRGLGGWRSQLLPRLLPLSLGALWLSGFWLLGRGLAAGIVLAGVAVLLGVDARPVKQQLKQRSRTWLYGLLAFGLVLIAIVVNALATGSLLQEPGALLSLPILVKNLAVAMPYHGFHRLRYSLLSPLGGGLLWGLLGLELWRPGMAKVGLERLGHRVLTMVRQPVSWELGQVRWPVWLLLSLLLVILGFVVHQQLGAGVLSGEAGQFVLRIFGCFLILPGLLGGLVLRSPLWQRWERLWSLG